MKSRIRNTQPSLGPQKDAPLLVQMGIFAAILFVSSLISPLFPPEFPVPTPVIGLIILYTLLTLHIIKLEWVEKFATSMIGFISFFYLSHRVFS